MMINVDDLPVEEEKMTQLDMSKFGNELFVPRSFAWVINKENIKGVCIMASTEF
ncbi:hypothetical protein J2S17_002870 [Cytobacillus purgationiresistens]|uniref:Uncharacterized protein n=2 Tax=Cytobacillus purgationiresistens TaxID=863449 RepID=A0ABU0AI99_9BACI|nr:hypothetical protein [Cytobacillus purgationiresistens]